VDWEVRDFHGYRTERGSSYNAYLIQDERPALIDTVKSSFAGMLLEQIRGHVGPGRLAHVVCNHAEPDHAGALREVMAACPNAELVCDAKCRDALSRYLGPLPWRTRIVKDGDTLSLGARTLTFLETPMVHWPESMFTYIESDGLLFSMDAFGQHYASAGRFDDEEPIGTVMEEAKTYYANIVMLYARPIARCLERAQGLDIRLIAPSHGVIWRKNLSWVLDAYRRWTSHQVVPKVVVLYDTMWRSTEAMARAIASGAMESAVDVRVHHVRRTSSTVIATEVLDAACLAVGSATLNQTLMPEVAATLTYLKGLRPVGKAALAFGSHGWSGGGARDVNACLAEMKLDVIRTPIEAMYLPDAAVLDSCREAGRVLGGRAAAAAAG
jgi:flavorubredoxin